MTRVLLTGFTAFHGETVNPSQEVIELIKYNSNNASPLQIDTLILPVSFKRAPNILCQFLIEKKAEQTNYSLILMLGQAGGRSEINLERVALNWQESEKEDEDHFVAMPASPIRPELNTQAYFSELPLETLKKLLIEKTIPTIISNSAGSFVCNKLYFEISHYLKSEKYFHSTQFLFVHLPYLPVQTIDKPNHPASMELDLMSQAVRTIIDKLCSEI